MENQVNTGLKSNTSPLKVNSNQPMLNGQPTNTANAPHPMPQAVSAPPQKSGCWKWVFISCGGILILLLLCFAVLFFGFTSVFQSLNQKEQFDKSAYTTLSPNEIEQVSNVLNDKFDLAMNQSRNGDFTVEITEKEMLQSIGANLTESNKDILNGLFIDIKPGVMTVKVDIGKALMTMPEAERPANLDPKQLEEVYLTIEFGTSTDGSQVTIQKISTGNDFIDYFIPADFNSKFQTQFNDSLEQGLASSNYKIKKVSFLDGYVEITFQPVITTR